jgi:hypothetical protein
MDALVLGLAGIIVGTLVAGFGARAFYVLLPLWAAVSGFLLGAEVVTELFGGGLLAMLLGWLVGAAVALAFALMAGLFWYAAVVILAWSVGYGVATGLLSLIGIEPGLVTALAGMAAGVAVSVLAILVDAPNVLVALLTAFGGAALGVAGTWLLLGQITLADLDGRGPLGALRGDPIAIVLWLVLGTAALVHQVLDLRSGTANPVRLGA